MGNPQYFDSKTYWSIKWHHLMIVDIIVLLFYSLILPHTYTIYILILFIVSWLYYIINFIELKEKKKKDELENNN